MEKKPELQIVGVLHGDITSREDAPKNYSESERVGSLEIFPEYEEALDGIAAGQTIVVLFWLHQAARDVLKVHPRGTGQNPFTVFLPPAAPSGQTRLRFRN